MDATTIMPSAEVLAVLEVLRSHRLDAWLAGGWAVDALLAEQTRPHGDLDLAIRAEHVDPAVVALEARGYRRMLDLLPVRLVLAAPDGRRLDLHPVTFDRAGVGHQPGDDGRVFEYPADAFGEGKIDGQSVACLSAVQLVRFHLGYEPRSRDVVDMALLRDRLGVEVPAEYFLGD
jgi:lincosamide nucleotidyltransferase A/C/D/E